MGVDSIHMADLTPDPYADVDIIERVRNDEVFDALMRRGIRRAMVEHQKIDNKVAIWRDGKVVLVAASEVLKQIDAA